MAGRRVAADTLPSVASFSQSYISKGVSYDDRASTLCPVVICPYLCTSDSDGIGPPFRRFRFCPAGSSASGRIQLWPSSTRSGRDGVRRDGGPRSIEKDRRLPILEGFALMAPSAKSEGSTQGSSGVPGRGLRGGAWTLLSLSLLYDYHTFMMFFGIGVRAMRLMARGQNVISLGMSARAWVTLGCLNCIKQSSYF